MGSPQLKLTQPAHLGGSAEPERQATTQQLDAPSMTGMIPEVYEELRRLAAAYLRGERVTHTLQPTALVHEAYLRLRKDAGVEWQNPQQVVGIFARVMRQTLINHAVARNRLKRGGGDPITSHARILRQPQGRSDAPERSARRAGSFGSRGRRKLWSCAFSAGSLSKKSRTCSEFRPRR